MTEDPPPTLGYATPQAPRGTNWNGVFITVALIQAFVCAYSVGLAGPAANLPRLLSGPSYIQLAVKCLFGPANSILYAVGSAIAIVAAMSPRGRFQSRLLRLYVLGWAAALLVSEISAAINQQWPGETTHRWVAEHNMATVDGSPGLFFSEGATFLFANPMIIFIALRAFDTYRHGRNPDRP